MSIYVNLHSVLLNGTTFYKVFQLILISFFQTQSKPRQLQQSPSSLSFVPIDVRKQVEVSFAAKTKQQKIQIRLQIRLSFRTDLCSNTKKCFLYLFSPSLTELLVHTSVLIIVAKYSPGITF